MNVPELRFKDDDGRDYPEWVEKKLGNVGRVSMCKRILKEQTKPVGDVPFYKIGTFGKQTDAYISNEIYESYKTKFSFPKKGDILISAAGTIGRTVVYDGLPAYFQDSNIVWIDNNEELVTNSFLYFIYANVKWNTENTTIARLYNENLRSLSILVPSLPEQTKIANFLTAIDERITQLTQKCDLLAQYKKGVMQQIFSQKIRFKDDDGRELPEWEQVVLGNVSDVRDGTHESPKYHSNGYPLITSRNLLENGTIDLENINLISESDFANFNKRSKVNEGDILFGMIGTIGNPVIVKESNFAIKNIALIKEKNLLLNKFLLHHLKSDAILKQFNRLNTGNTQKFIALNHIRNLQISLPSNKEQTKIANFLTAIDDKITHTQAQLAAMKHYKQGLLQQMFV